MSPAREGLSIPVAWSDRCLLHEPGGEVWIGLPDPGNEVPARAAIIRDALVGAGATLVPAAEHGDDALLDVHDAGPGRLPAHRLGRLGEGRLPGRSRPGSRGPVSLCPSWASRGPGARTSGRDVSEDRALRLRHDDADRPDDVGRSAGGRGRRAHGRGSRPGGRACRIRLHPTSGPPRDEERVRRQLLSELDRDRRATPSQPGSRHSCDLGRRRPPGKRRAGDLPGPQRCPDRLRSRRSASRVVSPLPRIRGGEHR